MSSTQANTEITVQVELNEHTGELFFTYINSQGVTIPTGDVTVTEATTITYNLNDKTGRGLLFVGVGFTTPFDGIIDSINVSNGGKTVTMVDQDSTPGTTKFQFVLSNSANSLLILSPDPEVVNVPE
jgi:hypothetical protein